MVNLWSRLIRRESGGVPEDGASGERPVEAAELSASEQLEAARKNLHEAIDEKNSLLREGKGMASSWKERALGIGQEIKDILSVIAGKETSWEKRFNTTRADIERLDATVKDLEQGVQDFSQDQEVALKEAQADGIIEEVEFTEVAREGTPESRLEERKAQALKEVEEFLVAAAKIPDANLSDEQKDALDKVTGQIIEIEDNISRAKSGVEISQLVSALEILLSEGKLKLASLEIGEPSSTIQSPPKRVASRSKQRQHLAEEEGVKAVLADLDKGIEPSTSPTFREMLHKHGISDQEIESLLPDDLHNKLRERIRKSMAIRGGVDVESQGTEPSRAPESAPSQTSETEGEPQPAARRRSRKQKKEPTAETTAPPAPPIEPPKPPEAETASKPEPGPPELELEPIGVFLKPEEIKTFLKSPEFTAERDEEKRKNLLAYWLYEQRMNKGYIIKDIEQMHGSWNPNAAREYAQWDWTVAEKILRDWDKRRTSAAAVTSPEAATAASTVEPSKEQTVGQTPAGISPEAAVAAGAAAAGVTAVAVETGKGATTTESREATEITVENLEEQKTRFLQEADEYLVFIEKLAGTNFSEEEKNLLTQLAGEVREKSAALREATEKEKITEVARELAELLTKARAELFRIMKERLDKAQTELTEAKKKGEKSPEYQQAKEKYEKARSEFVAGKVENMLAERMTLINAQIETESKKKGLYQRVKAGWNKLGEMNVYNLISKYVGEPKLAAVKEDENRILRALKRTGNAGLHFVLRALSVRTGISAAMLGLGWALGGVGVGLGVLVTRRAMQGLGTSIGTYEGLQGAVDAWGRHYGKRKELAADEIAKMDAKEIIERMAHFETMAKLGNIELEKNPTYEILFKALSEKLAISDLEEGESAEATYKKFEVLLNTQLQSADERVNELRERSKAKNIAFGVLSTAVGTTVGGLLAYKDLFAHEITAPSAGQLQQQTSVNRGSGLTAVGVAEPTEPGTRNYPFHVLKEDTPGKQPLQPKFDLTEKPFAGAKEWTNKIENVELTGVQHDSTWNSIRQIVNKDAASFEQIYPKHAGEEASPWAERVTANIAKNYEAHHGAKLPSLVHEKDLIHLERTADGNWEVKVEELSGMKSGYLPETQAEPGPATATGAETVQGPNEAALAEKVKEELAKQVQATAGQTVAQEAVTSTADTVSTAIKEQIQPASDGALRYALEQELSRGRGVLHFGSPREDKLASLVSEWAENKGLTKEQAGEFVNYLKGEHDKVNRDLLDNYGIYDKKSSVLNSEQFVKVVEEFKGVGFEQRIKALIPDAASRDTVTEFLREQSSYQKGFRFDEKRIEQLLNTEPEKANDYIRFKVREVADTYLHTGNEQDLQKLRSLVVESEVKKESTSGWKAITNAFTGKYEPILKSLQELAQRSGSK